MANPTASITAAPTHTTMVRWTQSVRRTAMVMRKMRLETQAAAIGSVAAFRQQPVRLAVPGARLRDDVGGEGGRGRLLVPFEGREVVADELLVEARVGTARLVLGGRAKTRGIRRQRFVDQDGLAGRRINPELQLRVGDDDALALGIGSRPRVQREADLADELGRVRADERFHLLERNVQVVRALFGLGGWGEERPWQFLGFDKTLGQGLSADLAGLLIVRPA